MSVRLNKNQIDKVRETGSAGVTKQTLFLFQAAKDKSGKFHDNFNVTLFLVRPNDQTLQEEFSRSNMICQVTTAPPPLSHLSSLCSPQRGVACESSEESSEEEPAELRRRLAPAYSCQEPVVRTLSAHNYPPLTIASQPANRLSEMTLSQSSQSTWI